MNECINFHFLKVKVDAANYHDNSLNIRSNKYYYFSKKIRFFHDFDRKEKKVKKVKKFKSISIT